MTSDEYHELARFACRVSPTGDVDPLHDAWIETAGQDRRHMIGRTKRRAIDERRRMKRMTPEFLGAYCKVRVPLDPAQEVSSREQRAVVRNAVAELPAKYRQIIELRWWDERSPKEIAISVELALKTVYTRLDRAINQLKEKLISESESS